MKALWTVLFSILTIVIFSQIYSNETSGNFPIQERNPEESYWVDSVFSALTADERIAQLFMVAAYSNRSMEESREVTELVTNYNIGGIIFFQGGPLAQARMANTWQSLARTPLLIGIDGEWGLGMRLKDSTLSYPKQMTLGAIENDSLIYAMGADMARQCRRIGVQVNFAPVVDVNCNPKNPVINYRSFGEIRENVARKGIQYMRGMQDQGVMASAKHFPGHGDTDEDSHLTLPIIHHSKSLLDSVDLFPFRALIGAGLDAVMVAHLYVPAIDTTNSPTTLSEKVIRELLQEQMGFNGLVITDALNMEGVKISKKPGELEVRALQAGVDILLMSENVPMAIAAIKVAIAEGRLKESDIEKKCKNVLRYKFRAGLCEKPRVNLTSLYQDLNTPESEWLQQQLYASSVTIAKNENQLLPLQRPDTMRIACVSIGNSGRRTVFQTMAGQYARLNFFNLPKNFSDSASMDLLTQIDSFDLVIMGLHSANSNASSAFGITSGMVHLVKEASARKPLVLDLFASPYALAFFGDSLAARAVIVSYQDHIYAQQAGAEAIFGGIGASGRLPVTASGLFPASCGIQTGTTGRLKFTLPEDAGLSGRAFQRIDSIVLKGINDRIFPGCQVLVAFQGKVIYQKSFGFHTYDKDVAVRDYDLYDLASVTKVAATTLAIMKLYEEGRIDLDEKLGYYLPELEGSNKAGLHLRDLLSHQAGLQGFIPFYKDVLHKGQPDTLVFKKVPSAMYPLRVADSLYIRYDYPDTLFKKLVASDLRKERDYKYSDLGFMLLKRLVEKLSGQTLDAYVDENFYRPLGLGNTGYCPREHFPLERIIPTEVDGYFRHARVQGDVHDPAAAMFGGVQGHAGLFSNASDLAVLFQMLLQGGTYAGRCYLTPETIETFTKSVSRTNRRGLGFDKPTPERGEGPTCAEASDASYGHTGFTGTYVWADPDYQLVYIFLSNRTYPWSETNKLAESGIRTKIQKIIYQALIK